MSHIGTYKVWLTDGNLTRRFLGQMAKEAFDWKTIEEAADKIRAGATLYVSTADYPALFALFHDGEWWGGTRDEKSGDVTHG